MFVMRELRSPLKRMRGPADAGHLEGSRIVGDCIAFHFGGNRYRLISRVRHAMQKVFVLRVMTHT
jgi:mRNA-degrading endonuclease HigB of HigAB toxin-antitoxin module